MRLTYSDLISLCQNNAGGDTSTASLAFFKTRINSRYEQILSKLPTYYSEIIRTFSTAADQQYYHYPPNFKEIKSLNVTIGSVSYPLTPVHSNQEWLRLNEIDFQGGAIPQYFFKRQSTFGIWPIPQGTFEGVVEFSTRASTLSKTDYTTGTVTATEDDATIEGSGVDWSSGDGDIRANQWFTLTAVGDTSVPRGSWYIVSSITDSDTLELDTVFEETTESGVEYKIGDSPDIPEDLHELIAWGATADYYASLRQSQLKAQGWNNMFWTGDFSNSSRDQRQVAGGLIDGIRRYQDRNESQLITRKKDSGDARLKVWSTTLS